MSVTLVETRTGMDWCRDCVEEVGTNRYRDDLDAERCATCGGLLMPTPQVQPWRVKTAPFQAAVMPCSGCREPLNLSDMVWLSGGRVGCAQCARRGR